MRIRMSNPKRALSLGLICAFALAALALAQTRPAPDKSQADRRALAKKPAPTGTLRDRLAADDKYALVIFFSADVHGNLEVCGCPIHPLGGVARRMGYINAFRRRSPGAATLAVDAGYVFSDDLDAAGDRLRDDARLMNDWIVRANEQMPLDVVNLSYRDLRYTGELLGPDARLKPEKSALVSANIKASIKADGGPSPAPYVIKTVTGRRLPRPVRVAFIGLSDLPPDELKGAVEAGGFAVEDPLAAAKTALAEVRDRADLTVVVGYLKLSTANKLALQNDDLDLIITADVPRRGLIPDPKQVNNALVLVAAKETKYLGELRCYADAAGVIDRFTARYVELDEVIPDDPQMAEVTRRARAEIDQVQTRMAEAEAAAHEAKVAAGGPASPYVTSAACATCHQAEYQTWERTRHARAFAALEARQRPFDAACVGCHSAGFQQGGFVNIKATPQFAGVGCESCHGPGAEHVKQPKAGGYPTPAAPASCVGCHDRDNSPDFVFARYWPVVAHGGARKGAK